MANVIEHLFHLNRFLDFHSYLGIPNWLGYTIIFSTVFFVVIYFMHQDPPRPTSHTSLEQLTNNRVRTSVSFQRIPTNGIKLHTLVAGDPSKPLVILLHGFPEFWKTWECYIDELVNAGYYVMVPDQRGYNLSSKPTDIGDYKMTKLADDIIGLIDFAKKEKAYLASHDWGALVAWYLVTQRPEKFYKAVIVSAPHTSAAIKVMSKDPVQRSKMGYMKFFQLPFIPQHSLSKNNFYELEKILLTTSNPGTFTSEDIRAYKQAWNDRGTLNGMLHWYRAALMKRTPFAKDKKTAKIPVKIIWGKKDHVLGTALAEESLKYCEQGSLDIIEDGTHWLLHEHPEKIRKIIIDFFRSG